jgi:acrylyl-CoA reductase (NADPH)
VRGVSLLGVDTVEVPIEERRTLWNDMAAEFPLDRIEDMVNEEIGLDGLTAALGRVLDAAVRGRILVEPGRS